MDIRYFFITDCVKKGLASIEYCPTEEMHGDFFTKPLQGSLLHAHRAMILGLDTAIEHNNDCRTADQVMDMDPQERVEPYSKMTKGLDI